MQKEDQAISWLDAEDALGYFDALMARTDLELYLPSKRFGSYLNQPSPSESASSL